MTKRPEEMAHEKAYEIGSNDIEYEVAKDAFLAGYQAAKDEDKAKVQNLEANWKFCCEDKNRLIKELAATERTLDKVADANKVMKFNKGNNAEMEKVNMKFVYDSFPVTDEQAQNVKQIRETFSSLTDLLSQLVPNGRYLSIVNTKLEEACMFAIKGITHQAGDYDKLQHKA